MWWGGARHVCIFNPSCAFFTLRRPQEAVEAVHVSMCFWLLLLLLLSSSALVEGDYGRQTHTDRQEAVKRLSLAAFEAKSR